MAPEAKLPSVSWSAKPTMNPMMPSPASRAVTCTPTWDRAVKNPTIRMKFDVVPTIMEAAHVEWPEVFHGIEQKPLDGQSFLYAFNDADTPTVKERQYYEMFGNRAIWSDGWKAVTSEDKPY